MRRRLRNHLSKLLFDRNLSDRELAERTGIGRTRINRLKNRRARPTVGDALRIAAAMSLRVTEVFWLDEGLPASAHAYAAKPSSTL